MNIIKILIKQSILFIGIFIVSFSSFSQNNETECKVLLENIADEYIGACKNGLAHGKGEAKGIHSYSGKFKNGYPHGLGKYIWENGDYYEGSWKEGKKSGRGVSYTAATDTKLKGIWKNNEFIKEIIDPPYNVIVKTGVTGLNFYEDDQTPYRVEVVFQKDGSQTSIVGDLFLNSSSGQSKVSSSFSGFENVIFPFEGNVEFVAPTRMGSTLVDYKVKFKITKESSWRVVIRY